jgi:acid phosphatase class B
MLQAIALFFSTWFARFRAFAMLAGAWGFLFSVNSLIGFQAAFEYDDGIVYSTPAFQAAVKDKTEPGSPDYWNAVNRSYSYERLKPVPWAAAWALRVLGVRIAFVLDRGPEGADSLEASWRRLADSFYFTRGEDEKYKVLEKRRFVLYAAPSDSGVIQARKAGVTPLRIKKSPGSVNPLESNPGKFGERSLPLSGF